MGLSWGGRRFFTYDKLILSKLSFANSSYIILIHANENPKFGIVNLKDFWLFELMKFIFVECELLSWVLETTNLQRAHVNPGVIDNMTVNSPITNTNFSFGLKVLCRWQNFTKVQMHCLHFLKTNDKVTIWQILTIKCLKHFSLRPCWKRWTSCISWIIVRLWQRFPCGEGFDMAQN